MSQINSRFSRWLALLLASHYLVLWKSFHNKIHRSFISRENLFLSHGLKLPQFREISHFNNWSPPLSCIVELVVSGPLLLAYITLLEGTTRAILLICGLGNSVYMSIWWIEQLGIKTTWIISGLFSSLELLVYAAPWRALGSLDYISKEGQLSLKTLKDH